MNNLLKHSIISTAIMAAPAMADWTADALSHQSRLQKHVPLVDGIYAGTHNSYSSNAYDMRMFENQDISITAQLNAGARFLELDIYRTRDIEYGAIFVCHNKAKCGHILGMETIAVGHKDFVFMDDILREVSTWTKNNPDQVLLIKIENGNMEPDDWHLLQESIQRQIADVTYRPESFNQAIPSDLTPVQMLELGKQVLFFGYSANKHSTTGKWLFQYNGSETDNASSRNSCSTQSDGRFALFFEQREEENPVHLINGTPPAMTTSQVTNLSKCGGTWLAFDWLEAQNDARMTAAVWSWDNNEPNNIDSDNISGNANCAYTNINGRLQDDYCDNKSRSAACESDTGVWKVTSNTTTFANAAAICNSEFGQNFRFSVPKTSKQNEKLKQANTNNRSLWVNYQKNDNDHWLSGKDSDYLAAQVVNPKTDTLKAKIINDYIFKYNDYKTGSGLGITVYHPYVTGTGWYILGDTYGLSTWGRFTDGYDSTPPGHSIAVYDDGSGKLASPIDYTWRWNDEGTGGHYYGGFWEPVAPLGYTCIGDIASNSTSYSKPTAAETGQKCVRHDLLVDADSAFYWKDSGSGGDYDAYTYLTVAKQGSNVNHTLNPNSVRLSPRGSHRVLNFDKVEVINGPKPVFE